jgi:CDP-glycerol glycerophosphotransferase
MKYYSENSFVKKLYLNFQLLIGWTFIIPVSILLRKKKGLSVVVGNGAGLFADNTKYFYLYHKDNKSFFFITQDKSTKETLNSHGIDNVLFHPSIKSIITLLRAENLFVDNVKWNMKYKYYLLFKSNKIQLWHGIGLKRIELDNPRNSKIKPGNLAYTKGKMIGTLPYYNYIISTSDYYEENFYKNAFRRDKIVNLGQPRNDIFFRDITKYDLINVDNITYDYCLSKQSESNKIVLYTPTFRDTGGNLESDKSLNFSQLNSFCKKNNIIFIIKQHPYSEEFVLDEYSNLILVKKISDIYPILSISDLLITDYSSIYLDYILINKPIIFFLYDFEKYTKTDRSLRGDFLEITPGMKCYNQSELEMELSSVLINSKDNYNDERLRICNLSYKFRDGNSSERISELINV